jgi:flagellar basal body-associated protein FliL
MDEQLNHTPPDISAATPPLSPPSTPVKKEKEGLRTYATDFGKSISGERGDMIRRAIADEERKAQAAKAQTLASKQNILLLVGSVLSILIGIGAIIFLAIGNRPKTIEPSAAKVPSIVFADASVEIPFTGLSKEQLVAQATAAIEKKISSSSIENIFFTEIRSGMKYLTTAKTFLSLISKTVPTQLTDGLENTFMFGAYDNAGKNAPFLIFKTDAYNDAFAGMKEWEARLFDDTYQLFGIATTGENANLLQAKFTDATLMNKNARVLRNSAGTIVLLYAFPDEQTIVITTDPVALTEVSTRLTSQKVIQPAL